jgi:Ser/Thr protein kinase RdoA (MazF antagonist)
MGPHNPVAARGHGANTRRMPESAADFADVFAHFGITPTQPWSCYPWAPVFPAERDGVALVVKHASARTPDAVAQWCRHLAAGGVAVVTPAQDPAVVDGQAWVVYPWITGRRYEPCLDDVAAAGDLLGRIHAASNRELAVAVMRWPEYQPEELERVLGLMRARFAEHAPEHVERLMARLDPLGRGFETVTLPAIRDADLPVVVATSDYKANNLVFTANGPVLIDPDNGERMPRILDLALAVLLFHNELDTAPGRLFTPCEWAAFRDAYLAHVTLTDAEYAGWPDALDYQLWDEGTWAIEDCTEWEVDRQRALLVDLAGCPRDAYPLRPGDGDRR